MTLRKLQNLSKAFLGLIYISLPLFVSGLAKFNFVISFVFAIFVALLQDFVTFVMFETEFNPGHISLCGELLRPLARLKFDQFQTLQNNSQQHATQLTCNNVCIRTQHATILRLFARGLKRIRVPSIIIPVYFLSEGQLNWS